MSIQNHDCKIYIIVTRSYLSRSLSSDFRVWDKGKTSHAIKLLTKLVYWMISFSLIYNLYRLTINNKQTNKQTNKMSCLSSFEVYIILSLLDKSAWRMQTGNFDSIAPFWYPLYLKNGESHTKSVCILHKKELNKLLKEN